MNQVDRRKWLIEYLQNERGESDVIPESQQDQIDILRSLLNVRPATEPSTEFLRIQDEYLQQSIKEKGIVDADTLPRNDDGFSLWQGDITLLKCDAIVNAANSGLTGCWIPNHKCIDNCIHTYAGVQLRITCDKIIKNQGHTEPFGQAKITDAFNLPAKKVIHTVGPIVQGELNETHINTLASSYKSCLEIAENNNLESIAFCCISTGVFCFPNKPAAEIAVRTCKDFVKTAKSVKHVIFNVFLNKDREIYENILN